MTHHITHHITQHMSQYMSQDITLPGPRKDMSIQQTVSNRQYPVDSIEYSVDIEYLGSQPWGDTQWCGASEAEAMHAGWAVEVAGATNYLSQLRERETVLLCVRLLLPNNSLSLHTACVHLRLASRCSMSWVSNLWSTWAGGRCRVLGRLIASLSDLTLRHHA